MKEVGRGGRSGPGDVCQQRQHGACAGLSSRSGNPACLRCPGGTARPWVSHPAPPGPGSCQPIAVRGLSTQGWWDAGGLTQGSDQRTDLDTEDALEGTICYRCGNCHHGHAHCCCSCPHGQQMQTWALRPDTQPPDPGPMPDPP